ncbi:hydrogenase-4 component E [Anaerospora hongkongensis]|uniref:Hydrogenase-4 component E n=1 Tax=Anaerospora hongkongensis TaxID=244830 RepID=A0A4R1Q721_9FIRM|nr:hydrogenase [Anaerospora hongkongensis]TCL37787.1 hydrogenase-4 component E [Anaerospora hongkongensis]
MELLTILLLLAAILQTRISNLRLAINVVLVQSVIVAMACVIIGMQTHEVHMFIAALLTSAIKVGIIPFALYRLLPYLREEREIVGREIVKANFSTFMTLLSIIVSYGLISPNLPGVAIASTLPAAVSLTLIGLFFIMMRHQAVMQIIGLITMENGLYLFGLSITQGLPLIIEMGIFLDVLVAVVVLVILTYRLKLSLESTDTSLLKKLKG